MSVTQVPLRCGGGAAAAVVFDVPLFCLLCAAANVVVEASFVTFVAL